MRNIINNCYIKQYNSTNLKQALKNDFISLNEIEKNKRHYTYLLEYLGDERKEINNGLEAGMIIVEKKYTSRSYLDDYQEHYFMSYKPYERHCERIHFFRHKVDISIENDKEEQKKIFETLIGNSEDSTQMWNGYLGYLVKRPIPTGIIGATILDTYPVHQKENNYERKYTVTTKYKINVFGKEISIKSLIYVEQDRIVGACATSALYVAFHRLSHLFGSKRPNQKKISEAAGISFSSPNRKLMNKDGLSTFQICKVVEKFGLEPEIYSLHKREANEIKSILYAYLKMGIPIIFGFKFDNINKILEAKDNEEDHAITLTGYAEPLNELITHKSYVEGSIVKKAKKALGCKVRLPLYLKSNDIDQFYAHDDQIGPFARIKIKSIVINEKDESKIISSWWDKEKGVDVKLTGKPFVSIVPISDRIRIPYEIIKENVEIINNWLHEITDGLDKVVWDIYLSRSNKEKKNIRDCDEYKFELHSEVLSQSLPKYVWVADCLLPGMKLMKILFDASDINHKHLGWDIVYYNTEFKRSIHEYFETIITQESINQDNQFINELLEGSGIDIPNLFRESVNLDPLKI